MIDGDYGCGFLDCRYLLRRDCIEEALAEAQMMHKLKDKSDDYQRGYQTCLSIGVPKPQRDSEWIHIKTGNLYVVRCLALDADNPQLELIVYTRPGKQIWVRPYKEWHARFRQKEETT